MELFHASKQWAERPEDERFETLESMHQACKSYADAAKTAHVPYSQLRAEAIDGEVQLTGRSGVLAKFTHWAFGQLCRTVEAPADYLRELPATLAVQNLNHGLKEKADGYNGEAQLLFHQNGGLLLRSVTSDKYARIWNRDVTARILPLQNDGWKVPPARPAMEGQRGTRPATQADVLRCAGSLGIAIKEGDLIAPAGLYASDHDMFAFMVNESKPIDSGTGKPMYKGFFAWNSEVGAASFGLMTFLYDSVCGNHIVWGAKDVREIRIRHIGNADVRSTRHLAVELKNYVESSVGDIEMTIARARRTTIAMTKDEVLDSLFKKRVTSLVNLDKAYQLAEKHEDLHGAPNTVWGMVSGLTRLSQETPYADQRAALDRSAAKILEITF